MTRAENWRESEPDCELGDSVYKGSGAAPDVHLDVNKMLVEFGIHTAIVSLDEEELGQYLNAKLLHLQEEYNEIVDAALRQESGEFVDGCIDLMVILVGTLVGLGVDFNSAWNSVRDSNEQKESGPKGGWRDKVPGMVKPEGWEPPCHNANLGRVQEALKYLPQFNLLCHKQFGECRKVLAQKNADYEGFGSGVNIADYFPFGMESVLTFILTKVLRLKSLLSVSDGSGAHFESVADSLIDLANYAVIGRMYQSGDLDSEK